MDNHKWEPDSRAGNPDKAYREELENKGSTFTDTRTEADGRDKAKVEKVLSGETQKMDTSDPDDLGDDGNDDAVRRETLANK